MLLLLSLPPEVELEKIYALRCAINAADVFQREINKHHKLSKYSDLSSIQMPDGVSYENGPCCYMLPYVLSNSSSRVKKKRTFIQAHLCP